MKFLKFFGVEKKEPPHNDDSNVLHLWEDDYLMVELLSSDNLDFLINETRRIHHFAEEHFDGTGFTDIMQIGDKPIKTIEKLIDISEIETLMIRAGLEKVQKFHMQGVGLLKADKAPFGFGSNNFAVIFEKEGNLVTHIWLTGQVTNKEEQDKLTTALQLLGKEYNFIAVNWNKCNYYDLVEKKSIEKFIETIAYK